MVSLSDLEIRWSRQEEVKVATPKGVGQKANAVAQTVPEEIELVWQRHCKRQTCKR